MNKKYLLIDLLIEYLIVGKIPVNLSDTNNTFHKMFHFLKMKNTYKKYLLEKFNKRAPKNLFLRVLTKIETDKLHVLVRGPAEYFVLYNMINNQCKYFLIGPYKNPIQKIGFSKCNDK